VLYIHHAGVWRDFGTMTDANAYAEYVFAREGIIVSIVDKLP